MNVQFLIDQIVRQTTVLIAQLATTGGVRAPLAHVANQVFLDLARELEAQGVSRKVGADMFGMALRAYLRKIQRLNESTTDRGRSLWQAVLDHLGQHPVVTRAEVLRRFSRDEPAVVRGVLHDLTESGLVFCSGSGPGAVYRIATADEIDRMRGRDDDDASDTFVWALVYRLGPLSQRALCELAFPDAARLDASLRRLVNAGRVWCETRGTGEVYGAREFYVPFSAEAGWEAAVFDHFQALVQTICTRLRAGDAAEASSSVGGSTYTLDVWPGHPLRDEALGVLPRVRADVGKLRERIEAHNREHGMPAEYERVIVYGGQCVIGREPSLEDEENDDA